MLRKLLDLLRIQGHGDMLNVGDKAPDFDVLDHHGKPARLRDFAGRTVVLWFYPKADTPG